MQHTSSSTSILIPVLKSNAYGHGLRQLCNIIMTINPKICPLLAVDSYPEYKLLHRYTDRDILIMGEQNPQNYHLYDRHRTHLAIGTLTNLRILLESGKCFHIQMFLNTSMNREGFQRQTLYQALELRQNIDHNCILTGIMSHCAGADIADDTSIIDQLTLFKKMYQTIIDILPRNQTQKIHYIHL
jgi:alanine racemase